MSIFKKGPTTKFDVLFAVCGAVAAIWKANDTVKQFKYDQEALTQKENSK